MFQSKISKSHSYPGLVLTSDRNNRQDEESVFLTPVTFGAFDHKIQENSVIRQEKEEEIVTEIVTTLVINNNYENNPERNRHQNRLWVWLRLCKKYVILYPMICFCIWGLLYILWDDKALAGGSLFALLILEIVALFLGKISNMVGLPPFLGMIVAGFLLRNIALINVGKDLPFFISSPLRGMSVVVLLTRGALSVNFRNIRKYIKVVPPLAIGSCIFEAFTGSLAAHFIIGFPMEWAIFMGFIFSAMSGMAVKPYLLEIEKSLPLTTNAKEVIVIAKTACGLDAILAICLAKFSLGFVFCEANTVCGFSKGPLEVLIGGAFGILWGGLSGIILNNESGNDLRTLVVFSGGVMSLVGLSKIGFPRGGPLGVFLGALITSTIWRRRKVDGTNNDQLNVTFKKLWFLFEPLLFGILGARTDFEEVYWIVVLKGLLCLGISLTSRIIASFILTRWSNLSIRERLFITVSWIPKGTVQAALGPVALDTALQLQLGDSFTIPGNQVMNISAAVIVTTSILGPIILKILGPRLLAATTNTKIIDSQNNCSDIIKSEVKN